MFQLIFCLLVAAVAVSSATNDNKGVTWAVLVAGSNEYYNYRHQADVCHAYQILHKNGIPDERIIVMMYDDIANNDENPRKGQIINRPNGPNVYAGVPKDYTGKTVTPKNFMHVLTGNKEALASVGGSGKVVNSGPNDNVFVFFSDHGAPGIIAFPSGDVLHASQLNDSINSMHKQNKYNNMVVYVEACESGSMFENILSNLIRVYATSASNSKESSYACYYDDELNTYLGDLYSVSWMENSDSKDLSKETLEEQFKIVRQLTNLSHVMEFGNLSIAEKNTLNEFQGNGTVIDLLGDFLEPVSMTERLRDAVPSEQVRTTILKKRIEKETDPAKRMQLIAELKRVTEEDAQARQMTKQLAAFVLSNKQKNNIGVSLKDIVSIRRPLRNHECYRQIVDYMVETCFDFTNQHFLKTLYVVVNLCEINVSVKDLKLGIDYVCQNKF